MNIKHGEYNVEGRLGDWTVYKTKMTKDDEGVEKETTSNQSHHATFYQCLFKIFNGKLSKEEAADLREAITVVNRIGKELKEVADEIDRKLTLALKAAKQ